MAGGGGKDMMVKVMLTPFSCFHFGNRCDVCMLLLNDGNGSHFVSGFAGFGDSQQDWRNRQRVLHAWNQLPLIKCPWHTLVQTVIPRVIPCLYLLLCNLALFGILQGHRSGIRGKGVFGMLHWASWQHHLT